MPAVDVMGTFTDNILQTHSNRRWDVGTAVTPSVAVIGNTPNTQLRLFYAPTAANLCPHAAGELANAVAQRLREFHGHPGHVPCLCKRLRRRGVHDRVRHQRPRVWYAGVHAERFGHRCHRRVQTDCAADLQRLGHPNGDAPVRRRRHPDRKLFGKRNNCRNVSWLVSAVLRLRRNVTAQFQSAGATAICVRRSARPMERRGIVVHQPVLWLRTAQRRDELERHQPGRLCVESIRHGQRYGWLPGTALPRCARCVIGQLQRDRLSGEHNAHAQPGQPDNPGLRPQFQCQRTLRECVVCPHRSHDGQRQLQCIANHQPAINAKSGRPGSKSTSTANTSTDRPGARWCSAQTTDSASARVSTRPRRSELARPPLTTGTGFRST